MAFCPSCGAPAQGAAFCATCGRALAGGPVVQAPPSTIPAPLGQPYAVSVHVAEAKTSGMAIASLVFGIMGLLTGWIPVVGVTGWVMAILAIVLGASALSQINRSAGQVGGKGMAISGIVLGIATLGIAILFLTILAAILDAVLGVVL